MFGQVTREAIYLVLFLEDLLNLMLSLGGGRWSCTECGFTSKSTNVKYHIESKHIQSAGYICTICQAFSRSRNALNTHMSTKHKGAYS